MNVLVDALSGAVGEDMEIHEGARHKADDHADSQAKNQIIIFSLLLPPNADCSFERRNIRLILAQNIFCVIKIRQAFQSFFQFAGI